MKDSRLEETVLKDGLLEEIVIEGSRQEETIKEDSKFEEIDIKVEYIHGGQQVRVNFPEECQV